MTPVDQIKLRVFERVGDLADAFARELVSMARFQIGRRGVFTLALTGGNTPRPLYGRLACPDFRDAVDWSRVKIFFSDERAVGPDHPDSNYGMARHSLLGLGMIPAANIFRMQGEAADLDAEAVRYEEVVRAQTPVQTAQGFPALDLILLGMGEDGHVASLFPDSPALAQTERAVVATQIPRMGTRRITLTLPTLNAAREVWLLVTGAQKARMISMILSASPEAAQLPASSVVPVSGKVCWWLDRAAAAKLP